MATSTTNLNLIKPEKTDNTIVRETYNTNLDTIDGRFSSDYLAIQSKNSVNITGGSITGITDLAVADGGTGASDAAGARANLGLVIGTDVAACGANSDITSLTGLTTPLGAAYGGTGVANDPANTITFTGAYSLSLTLSGNTNITLPTSGTLADIGGEEVNIIGIAGEQGFGVGIAPAGDMPEGMTPLSGYQDPGNPNYGNYQYRDGSVMVWIPKFYYKITENNIDIKGIDTYPTTAQANADGYALHRAFIDGGVEKDGFFVDKYMISKNAWGTGYIGSSLKNGLPISTHADHNPIADLTACAGNYYYEMINAAHARDGINGEVNANSIFFCCSRFIYAALAMLSLAQAQASSSTTYCAWYNATYNYPKGCNNNALKDVDDTSVSYSSDGYSNCGKTGSGTPFAKTTHNGQECGVADLNGLMWEVSLGATCIAANKSITGATKSNPCEVTIAEHGYSTGDTIIITNVGGMTELNDKIYKITVIDADTFSLDGIDSTGYSTYSSGGISTKGTFYVAKQTTSMKDFTFGNSSATDHWGATGVAEMMDALSPTTVASMFKLGNGFSQRYGSGDNQVLDEATSGESWVKTGLGAVKSGNSIDGTGTNQFGRDYYYQYIRDELCLRSCGSWGNSTYAGGWALYWSYYRSYSSYAVGGRFACYPVPTSGTLETDTHASDHAVGGADTVFPADPGADRYLMWDDDPGELVWAEGSGGGATTFTGLTDTPTDYTGNGGKLVKVNTEATALEFGQYDIVNDTTPELGGELDCGAHSIGFTLQTATGDGTTTIDWKLGNKFKFTFGSQNETFTFTAPSNPCNLLLMLVQDSTGGRTATWPSGVKWPGGTAPTLSTGANAVDIISFWYDGTSYYGVASLNFSS